MSKTNINNVRVPLLVTLIGAAALSAMLPPGLRANPLVIDDGQMQALTTTIGGAQVLQTTQTVTHWFGWFMRLAPNYISEPTQSPPTNIGRYTFMGDLNQFPGLQQPATGCN